MKKKIAMAVASTLAVSAVLIGGTLAYLNDTTATAVNTFASNRNIQISLREPAWDGYTFADVTGTDYTAVSDADYAEAQGSASSENASLGFNQANSYVPGQIIPKNPTVKNTGSQDEDKSVSTYVAIKVEYVNEENTLVSYEDFCTAYLAKQTDDTYINFDLTSWTDLGIEGKTYDVYLYNSVLTPGNTTTPLFTNVPLSWDIDELPEFQIKVTAYAIQSTLPTGVSAAEAMLDAFEF